MRIAYQCEICGGLHETEDDAIACEIKHVRPMGVGPSVYSKGEAFPDTVRILFANGRTAIYERSYGAHTNAYGNLCYPGTDRQ